VFKLYVNTNKNSTHDSNETTTVGSPQTSDATTGEATFQSIAPGFYCVVETSIPAGHTGAADQCIEVGIGTAAGQGDDKNLTFKNPRTRRIVVVTCYEGTDTLDPSDVTIGLTTTKTSLAAGSLTDAAQKLLCDTPGASFGGLAPGSKSVTIDLQ
jgi:hypothetical protein